MLLLLLLLLVVVVVAAGFAFPGEEGPPHYRTKEGS